MPSLCQKTVTPTADTYLRSNIDEHEKSRDPDKGHPESRHKDVAFGLRRHIFLKRAVLLLEDQLKADQQDQAHPNPHDIDTIPPPSHGQESSSDHWAK